MKRTLLISLFLILPCAVATVGVAWARSAEGGSPKREFRGVWIQCVNGQYLGKTSQQVRQMLSGQLDVMAAAHINAVLFQVRAEGDALYASRLEPWSRYLTGRQGQAPQDGWDPLAWMVEECHRRGMECHAWINPYRVKTKGTTELAGGHVAVRHPNRVFSYGGQLILNPALEENRMYTCMVVEDILDRYDVDGIHMDDYFYPYPVQGENLPDEADFRRDPRGFRDIEDWRRDNVDLLIRDLHRLVREKKPWVKFGISPFGIYRNSPTGENSAAGSATSGLRNYEDLYADVLLWQRKGWVDYLIPQIYWNIGTKAADYATLCRWWNDYCHERPLFIGQDVERTAKGADPDDPSQNQTEAKYRLLDGLSHVGGTCQWYAASFAADTGGYRSSLQGGRFCHPALQPLMRFIDKKRPGKPQDVRVPVFSPTSVTLSWKAPTAKDEMNKAAYYVIYDFAHGEKVDIDDPAHILAIVRGESVTLKGRFYGHTLVLTTLDRLQNESKGVKVKLK